MKRRRTSASCLYKSNPSSMLVSSPLTFSISIILTTISWASSENIGRTFESNIRYGLTLEFSEQAEFNVPGLEVCLPHNLWILPVTLFDLLRKFSDGIAELDNMVELPGFRLDWDQLPQKLLILLGCFLCEPILHV